MKTRRDMDYEQMVANLPKPGPSLDIDATLKELDDILDIDKEKVRLQEALRESKANETRLEGKIGQLTNKLGVALSLADALRAEPKIADPRIAAAEKRAADAERKIRGADARARIAEGEARAAEFSIEYARAGTARAERERDEAKARAADVEKRMPEEVTRRVDARVAEVTTAIHKQGFDKGWEAGQHKADEQLSERVSAKLREVKRRAWMKVWIAGWNAAIADPKVRQPGEVELLAAIEWDPEWA